MSAEAPAATTTPTGAKGAVETIEPTTAQRALARRVAESKATIPDFQAAIEADVTALGDAAAAAAVAPYVAATGRALRRHPRLNGAYADAKFQHYSRANVGVALDGAIAVVVDADAKAPAAIAEELAAFAAGLRDGTLTGAAQSGATFTLSSLAEHGVTAFTAIIQPGQSAALAVGAPVARDGRLVATLTLSADHRIVTPADAGAFLAALREQLAAPPPA
jgi:pyruvate dehydrogenase E2 component (dihydrolipoamide acetyltransferase)